MTHPRTVFCAALLGVALAAAAPAQLPYGRATPGTGGILPRLGAGQPYTGHAEFAFHLDRGLGGAAAALLLSTARGQSQVLGTEIAVGLAPGELVLALPVALGGAAGMPGAGSAAVPASLAAAGPSLHGARVYLQALVADAPPSGALVAASNGLFVEVTDAPLLFLGADARSGAGDPYTLVDPRTAAIVQSGSPANTSGVNGAAFAAGGRHLLVASATRKSIEHADLSTNPPTWSTLRPLTDAPLGLALDPATRRLYTFVGPAAGAKDLVVLDGDPASPAFGSELGRAPALAAPVSSQQWALAGLGRRLAVYSGDSAGRALLLVDTEPGSPTYLQVVDRTPVPELTPPFNAVRRVRLTADGEVALVALNVGFFTAASGVHRYATAARLWLDHNPLLPGVQAIGPGSLPPATLVSSSDLALARDGSFATLTPYAAIERIDFDRNHPAAFSITRVTGAWTPNTSFGHTITTDGKRVLLLAPSVPLTSSDATLVDARTGAVLASHPLPAAPWISTFAER
jgi:hypothetical protein